MCMYMYVYMYMYMYMYMCMYMYTYMYMSCVHVVQLYTVYSYTCASPHSHVSMHALCQLV